MANQYIINRGTYGSSRWRSLRQRFLSANPLCIECKKLGRVTAANVVDHKIPHRGEHSLFWAIDNLQPLCKQCHDSYKQQLERSGTVKGCDADGLPLDKNHHWYKKDE